MKATTENEGVLEAVLLEEILSSINTSDFKDWDNDALFALWTAKFGGVQHADIINTRLMIRTKPKPLDDELYFEAVGAELFKRKLLTRIVYDASKCTLVPRGSNADR